MYAKPENVIYFYIIIVIEIVIKHERTNNNRQAGSGRSGLRSRLSRCATCARHRAGSGTAHRARSPSGAAVTVRYPFRYPCGAHKADRRMLWDATVGLAQTHAPERFRGATSPTALRLSVCPLAACGRASDAMSKVPARHGPAHRFMLLVCHAVVCACAQTVAAHVDDHNHPRQMGPPAAFLAVALRPGRAAALPGLGCVEAALLLVALRSLAVAGRAVALPP